MEGEREKDMGKRHVRRKRLGEANCSVGGSEL